MAEICLELKDITKSFEGETEVLKGISLAIGKGEFITLLGSSGCGKTTTLRIIAGLETPDSGQVFLDGKDVTSLAPEARDVNTVFQNYALFPHMNVADNIGYGLKLKKTPKAEIRKKVKEMLELLRIVGGGVDNIMFAAGDLDVTVSAGRSRTVGLLLGKGYTIEETLEQLQGQTLEAVVIATRTARAVKALAKAGKVSEDDFPLLMHVNELLNEHGKLNIPWKKFEKRM